MLSNFDDRTSVLEKASKSVWELILDHNGIGKEISETVEGVFYLALKKRKFHEVNTEDGAEEVAATKAHDKSTETDDSNKVKNHVYDFKSELSVLVWNRIVLVQIEIKEHGRLSRTSEMSPWAPLPSPQTISVSPASPKHQLPSTSVAPKEATLTQSPIIISNSCHTILCTSLALNFPMPNRVKVALKNVLRMAL
nr:Ubiquitin-conjugating enzyme E2 37 [Ipomoea batatas]